MTTKTEQHAPDGCLVCTVRALTEGTPQNWFPSEPASVKGVVLQVGTFLSAFAWTPDDRIPYAHLWIGGTDRVRIEGYGSLGREIVHWDPAVGDTMIVDYTGLGTIERGRFAGRPYRMHTVKVERGHH